MTKLTDPWPQPEQLLDPDQYVCKKAESLC